MAISTCAELPALDGELRLPSVTAGVDSPWLASLERSFGIRFTILDGRTGSALLWAPGQPDCDEPACAELGREAARRGRLTLVGEPGPVVLLLLPLGQGDEIRVAAGLFLTQPIHGDQGLGEAARLLKLDPRQVLDWAVGQSPWPAGALRRVGELTLSEAQAQQRVRELEAETASLSDNISATYEEISLLHRLTYNLKLSRSDADLGRLALDWLRDVLPAEVLALVFRPRTENDPAAADHGQRAPLLATSAGSRFDGPRLGEVVAHFGAQTAPQPLVFNPPVTEHLDWPFPEIRQLVVVPLAEGENTFGHLLAINRPDGGEYGTVEASLLNSVATILGIHSGNIDLYRQQSELLAGVIRALTSAIDAKDPYTCGHSDRVARIAVRLGRELGCDAKVLDTIYLGGLLHDVGKIGVVDSVLRKPGKLSPSEYDHIKQHPVIGHKILVDLKKLGDVLPVVLHHHESWDGQGYPQHLAAEEIPRLARILAVADSYDAMGSDRPYRQGMPDEKIDEIFRAGSGQQWDPEVVAAFFRARDDLHRIVHRDDPPA
jgi:hypothetical protein